VRELRGRGEQVAFDAAKAWCGSSDPVERELAANILSQLGPLRYVGEETLRPFSKQTFPLLEKLLDDVEPRVVAAAVYAYDQHDFAEPVAQKASLASHASARVRKQVAAMLWKARSPSAIAMLIKLSEDKVDEVRDWATFSLGSEGWDSPAIREALIRRLSDDHFDTRSEALIGLAVRKDARVLPALKMALEADCVGSLAVEAAREIGSPELHEALLELRSWWDVDTELLDEAIESCRPKAPLDPA
jgi:HEAT repeat protein